MGNEMLIRAEDLVEEIKSLNEVGLERTREGYYYIAHYPPLRSMEEISPKDAAKALSDLEEPSFEVYANIPYCEINCSFCHFQNDLTGRNFGEKEKALIDAELRELQLYKSILGGKISSHSFYIGGGTPSVLSNGQLGRLFEEVHSSLDFDKDAELKFEVFPRRFEKSEIKERLRLLRDYGFTDVVIDLESGNQDSLRRVGRGKISSVEAYKELVGHCVEAGFSSIITGLIVGLPHETLDSLGKTLETLVGIPEVQTINTFPLITREPDPILLQYRKNPGMFPSIEVRDLMLFYAREFLRENGFHEGPIAFHSRNGKRPEQQSDKFECVNLIALGPSGFGYLNGRDWAAQTFNYCNTPDWLSRVNSGNLGMWRAGFMNQEERARRKLIFGLANCKSEDLISIEERFGISVNQVFGKTLNALESLGIIKRGEDGRSICYTPKGLCRLEEVSYFLGSDEVNRKSRRDPALLDPQRIMDLKRRSYYININEHSEKLFREYEEGFSSEFI